MLPGDGRRSSTDGVHVRRGRPPAPRRRRRSDLQQGLGRPHRRDTLRAGHRLHGARGAMCSVRTPTTIFGACAPITRAVVTEGSPLRSTVDPFVLEDEATVVTDCLVSVCRHPATAFRQVSWSVSATSSSNVLRRCLSKPSRVTRPATERPSPVTGRKNHSLRSRTRTNIRFRLNSVGRDHSFDEILYCRNDAYT